MPNIQLNRLQDKNWRLLKPLNSGCFFALQDLMLTDCHPRRGKCLHLPSTPGRLAMPLVAMPLAWPFLEPIFSAKRGNCLLIEDVFFDVHRKDFVTTLRGNLQPTCLRRPFGDPGRIPAT